MERTHEPERRGLGWSPLPAAAACLVLIHYPDATLLRETTFWLMVLTLVLVAMGLISSRRIQDPALLVDLSKGAQWTLVTVGAVLTAVFWLRAWIALPTVWLGHRQLLLVQVLAFWWPAIMFAALCRQPGQGLSPPARRVFLRQLVWAMFGAVLGVLLQIVVLAMVS